MPEDTRLDIYVLSVGQADTSVILTPERRLIVIDAVSPAKLVRLLNALGFPAGSEITELVITHPHDDHFRGANRLLNEYRVCAAVLSPFWCSKGLGSPTYREMVKAMEARGVQTRFLSGYTRLYPDGAVTESAQPDWDSSTAYLEMLGPPNGLIQGLERAGELDTNHLSVFTRVTWKGFSMVFAGDAQMENWAAFDSEGMLERPCDVLKAAHHGSGNGTQWERLTRLDPKVVIVSSDPLRKDHLPDVVGAATFARLDVRDGRGNQDKKKVIALTKTTGTIRISAKAGGVSDLCCYGDAPEDDHIDLDKPVALAWNANPTDWQELLKDRVNALYGQQ